MATLIRNATKDGRAQTGMDQPSDTGEIAATAADMPAYEPKPQVARNRRYRRGRPQPKTAAQTAADAVAPATYPEGGDDHAETGDEMLLPDAQSATADDRAEGDNDEHAAENGPTMPTITATTMAIIMATTTITTMTVTKKNTSNPSAAPTRSKKRRSAHRVSAATTRSKKSSSAARSCWCRWSRKSAAPRARRSPPICRSPAAIRC